MLLFCTNEKGLPVAQALFVDALATEAFAPCGPVQSTAAPDTAAALGNDEAKNGG
jgi:hypothetical protein